jgi:hypothetical protein
VYTSGVLLFDCPPPGICIPNWLIAVSFVSV